MKKYKVGYTQGVFDMFHVGHLNLLKAAKSYCDYLIVGVNSDELVRCYKKKSPVIHEEERRQIIESIKCVDRAVIAHSLDKLVQHNELEFNAIFIGDDWKGSLRWEKTEQDLNCIGVDLIYLPYTKGVSSTLLRAEENSRVKECENI